MNIFNVFNSPKNLISKRNCYSRYNFIWCKRQEKNEDSAFDINRTIYDANMHKVQTFSVMKIIEIVCKTITIVK